MRRAAKLALACALSASLAVQPLFPCAVWAQPVQSADSLRASSASDDVSATELLASLQNTQSGLEQEAQQLDVSTSKLTQAGLYRLGADVDLDSALKVEAAQGQTIALDLNGHRLRVFGDSCAVDASASQGSVVIFDSTASEDAADAAGADAASSEDASVDASSERGRIVLRVDKAPARDETPCVVSAAPQQASVETDGFVAPSVIMADAALTVKTAKGVELDAVEGMHLGTAHLYLSGSFNFKALAADVASGGGLENAVALAAETADSISFLEGFAPVDKTLSVTSQEQGSGTVFAHAADAYAAADVEKNIALDYLGGSGVSCVFDGESRFVLSVATSSSTEEEELASSDAKEQSAGAKTTGGSKKASALRTYAASAKAATAADGRIDLNAAWKKAGTTDSYTIAQAGTYYLSDDLSSAYQLVINAPGKSVQIDFEGHSFACTGSATKCISITAAGKVALNGAGGAVSLKTTKPSSAIDVASGASTQLVVKNLNVSVSGQADEDGLKLTALGISAVSLSSGTLDMSSSSALVDLSDQGYTTSSGSKSPSGDPAAVKISSVAGACSISSSSLKVVNSPVVGVRDGQYSVGHAYGLYSSTAKRVSLNGCALSATSALSKAYGAAGANLLFTGEQSSLETMGAEGAYGIQSLASVGVCLDAPLAANVSSSTQAAALYAQADAPFEFAVGFSAASASVLVGTDADLMNDDGVVVGSFASGVAQDAREDIAASLCNAQGADAATSLVVSGDKLRFSLDEAKAPAAIVAADGTVKAYCASAAAAFARMESGQAVRLLADAQALKFLRSDAAADDEFSLDMNGHRIASLIHSSKGKLSVFSSNGRGYIDASGLSSCRGVVCSSSGSLSLQGVDISCSSSTSPAYGIHSSSSAAVTLDDVNVSAASARESAYAVYLSDSSAGALRVSGGSISASAISYGVSVCGIYDESTAAALSASNCQITAQGTNASTRGIAVKSTLSLEGVNIAVSTEAAVDSCAGVYAGAKSLKASLDACSIQVSGSQDANKPCWCLGQGGGTNDPVWKLSGVCSLSSSTSTEIQHYAQPLQLQSDFSLANGAWHVASLSTGVSAFAKLADGLDVSSLASAFAPVESGIYAAYTVEGVCDTSGARLSWKSSAAIVNVRTQGAYASLDAALAAADAGDELRLASDVRIDAAVQVAKSVNIDLNGHQLLVKAGADAQAGNYDTGGALAVVKSEQGAASTLAFKDSSAGKEGNVLLELGSANEGAGYRTYHGFVVCDGSALKFDAVQAKVVYTGSSTSSSKVIERGIALVDGSLSMEGACSLAVSAAASDGTFGASELSGIWIGSASTGKVSLSGQTRMSVVNNAAPVVSGSVDYPDYEGSYNAQSSTTVDMLEVKFDENDEVYKEIQEQFLRKAKCDTSSESRSLYKANVYYANNMTLSNGMHVWAYSEPVADDAIGKVASIVPAHIFVRSKYQGALDAYGIYAQGNATEEVDAPASINVQTSTGSAFVARGCEALNAWNIQESSVTASCSDDAYLSKVKGAFDLKDYESFDSKFDNTRIVYPSNASMSAVGLVKGSCGALWQTASSSAPASIDASQLDDMLYTAKSQSVTVSFANLRNADGSSAASQTCSIAYGGTLNGTAAAQGDYTVGGTTYRFIGWKCSGLDEGTLFEPGYVSNELVFNSSVSGVTSGSVTFTASYVPVKSGEHLVTFQNGHVLCAYAVVDGQAASYGDCRNSSGVIIPSLSDTVSGYTYAFAGWASGASSECILSDGETVERVLPATSEDAAYSVRFSKTKGTVALSLSYRTGSATSPGSLIDRTNYKFDWETSVLAYAKETLGLSDTVNDRGTIYSFQGFSPRKSDVEAVYTSDFYLSGREQVLDDDTRFFYAVYTSTTQLVDVSFYVNGSLKGSAKQVPATDKIISAVIAAGIDTDKLQAPSKSLQFRGWALSNDISDVVQASTETVFDVVGYNTELKFYAVWGTRECSITFCDSDGTRLGSTKAYYGQTILQSDKDFEITGLPSNFKCWVYEDGGVFRIDSSVVTGDITVYASYKKGSGSSDGGLVKRKKSADTGTSPVSIKGGGTSAIAAKMAVDKKLPSQAGVKGAGASKPASVSADASATSADPNSSLPSTIALLVVAVALAALVAFVLRWFIWRRKGDDDEGEELAAPVAGERICF